MVLKTCWHRGAGSSGNCGAWSRRETAFRARDLGLGLLIFLLALCLSLFFARNSLARDHSGRCLLSNSKLAG